MGGGRRFLFKAVDELVKDEGLDIFISGRLKGVTQKDLLNSFNKCDGFVCHRLKKGPMQPFAHLTFADEEQKKTGLKAIEKVKIKGEGLQFELKAKFVPEDSNSSKRRRTESSTDASTEAVVPRAIQDVVTPLWKLSYEEQLKQKQNLVRSTLSRITAKIHKDTFKNIPKWLAKLKEDRQTKSPMIACCPLEPIVGSPVIDHYRNKVSFTVGLDVNDRPCVGFALGAVKDNIVRIGDPNETSHCSERSLVIRNILDTHIKASSLPVYNKLTHSGFWREITVRTFSTGDGAVIIQVDPSALLTPPTTSTTESTESGDGTNATTSTESEPISVSVAGANDGIERINQEKQALIHIFERENITESLFWQPWTGRSNYADHDVPLELLRGPPTAKETLNGIQFAVSPLAFFQVNTKGAEVLYQIIADWAGADLNSTVLDICCGTGSISLFLAKSIKKVIGIEMEASAVENAIVNRDLNGMSNTEFIVGKAEDVVPDLLAKHQGDEFIAVVDPPRAGLHKNVLRAIKSSPHIKKVVFVSCDHTNGLLNNASALCRTSSKQMPGTPFKPVKAVAFDMFPKTTAVEVVMLLEREDLHGEIILGQTPQAKTADNTNSTVQETTDSAPEPSTVPEPTDTATSETSAETLEAAQTSAPVDETTKQ